MSSATGLVHLVAIILLEGVECRTGCFQRFGVGSGTLLSSLRS